ncbi:MAG: dual specificity protein phosphatase family protein [Gemmataceae bacterium]|nr:dual specificity protein phosphatase family protein [Gemmataceae bacterium]
MSQPPNFSWVDRPLLAALARPTERDEVEWLRKQGIQVLVSLTEERLRRDWANDAGLLVVHEPVEDMEAPTQDQLDRVIAAITRAHDHEMPVAVHCSAGQGRTGVILACYFVHKGLSAQNAVTKVRRLRPGSIETDDQINAVVEFAKRRGT